MVAHAANVTAVVFKYVVVLRMLNGSLNKSHLAMDRIRHNLVLDSVVLNLREEAVLGADRKLFVIDDLRALVGGPEDRLVRVLHALT